MSSLPLAVAVALIGAGEWVDLTWDTAARSAGGRAEHSAALDRALDRAVAHTTRTLGVQLSHSVKAHVYTRVNYGLSFGAVSAARHGAHYRAGMIHINGSKEVDESFVALVTHEMVHALLDDRGRGLHFPSWFNEGLAERARYQVLGPPGASAARLAKLRSALSNRRLGALPRTRGLSAAEYAIAWAAVVYLVETHGERKLLELVARVIGGADFDRVFLAQTGQSTGAFEQRFRAWAGTRSRPLPRFK